MQQALRARTALRAHRVLQVKMAVMVSLVEREAFPVTAASMDPTAQRGQTARVATTVRKFLLVPRERPAELGRRDLLPQMQT